MELFGTAGVRGPVGDVTPELAVRVGRAAAGAAGESLSLDFFSVVPIVAFTLMTPLGLGFVFGWGRGAVGCQVV
ncbi:MAG: hypothetical protein ABEH77_02110, partial [Halobacteriaceae archaeon]